MPLNRSPTRSQGMKTAESKSDNAHGPVVDKMADEKTNVRDTANVNAASVVKLSPFWRDNPYLWFTQVEATFAINRVTSDESHYRYEVVHLDQTVLPLIAELLTNPPEGEKYRKLKNRLISALGESSETRIRKLLASHELGDERPSIFLQRLRNLASGQVTE